MNKRKLVSAVNGRGLDMALMYIGNDVAEFGFVQNRLSSLLDKVCSKLDARE